MSASKPYRVEINYEGCTSCGSDRSWWVVGPDGIAGSTAYEVKEEAECMASELNAAYEAGVQRDRMKAITLSLTLADAASALEPVRGEIQDASETDAQWEAVDDATHALVDAVALARKAGWLPEDK